MYSNSEKVLHERAFHPGPHGRHDPDKRNGRRDPNKRNGRCDPDKRNDPDSRSDADERNDPDSFFTNPNEYTDRYVYTDNLPVCIKAVAFAVSYRTDYERDDTDANKFF